MTFDIRKASGKGLTKITFLTVQKCVWQHRKNIPKELYSLLMIFLWLKTMFKPGYTLIKLNLAF